MSIPAAFHRGEKKKKRGFIQRVTPGQINSDSLAKFPFLCSAKKLCITSPLPPFWLQLSGLGAGRRQWDGTGTWGRER